MCRVVCWSVVLFVAVALGPNTRAAFSQIPAPVDPAAPAKQEPVQEGPASSVPALPLMPALPALPALPAPPVPDSVLPSAQPTETPAGSPAARSLPVGNEVDATLHQKIESALDASADVDFRETPLCEVVAFLREAHKIPVMIDKRALDDVGLGAETPVTVSLHGISLRSILNLMLHELDLTYVVRDQVLKITTPEEAENQLAKRVYAVADLAVDLQQPVMLDRLPSRYDTVIDMITGIIATDSWEEVGGAGSAAAYDPWGVVVISQTRETHEAIGSLLTTVRKVQRSMSQVSSATDLAPVPMVPETEAQAAARAKINQALESMTTLQFSETPLQEVVGFLAETHGIPVVIDRRALDDVGLGSETPVTISLDGVSLRSALRIMLGEIDLSYVISNEVLKITTPEESEKELTTIVYPVPDFIVPSPDGGNATMADARLAAISDVIRATVEPQSWNQVGGAGRIVAVDPWGLLVISQTDEVLEEITDLLQTTRRARQADADGAGSAAGAPGGVPSLGAMGATASMSMSGMGSMQMGMGMGMGMAAPHGGPLVLKIYPVLELDVQQVISAIQGTVAPGTWGTSPDQGAIFPLGYRMLIRQTPAVHAEIAKLLEALQRMHQDNAGGMGGGMGGMGGGMFAP